ncbi:hypothetical protein [Chryseobacterium sp.]|uniref:hypothetical protein n=1 Tax=Chryseobacterium sp. TaxID=1871047 RepID=UPI0035AE10BE
MKCKNLLLLAFLWVGLVVNAQVRATVSSKTYDLETVKFIVDGFVFTLNADGSIADFNVPDLNGELEYYDDQVFDKVKYGKLKSIGNVKIDYWEDSAFTKEKPVS